MSVGCEIQLKTGLVELVQLTIITEERSPTKLPLHTSVCLVFT